MSGRRESQERILTRRGMLRGSSCGALVSLASLNPGLCRSTFADEPGEKTESLIESIQQEVIFPGRSTGVSWFHPRACLVPGAAEPEVLMTLQSISGSDVFGPVHWTHSTDQGKTWSAPQALTGLGRKSLGANSEVGVCDVVPEYHPQTKSVLAIGHNVYYASNVLARPQGKRWPVYTVRRPDLTWSEAQPIEWDNPKADEIFSCGCSQRLTRPNGDLVIPLTFGSRGIPHRSVTTALCDFDGKTIRIRKTGTVLENKVRRGLLEPSLSTFQGRDYLTIRAENGRGYVSTSEDGLKWHALKPWSWHETGEPLEMSTTQQHWLSHAEGLYLVYNRRTEENKDVIRWRAPLYIAKIDVPSLSLIRSTEKVVFPMLPGIGNDPKKVALMGNFHPVTVSPRESWVTVGENFPANQYRGNTLLARIHWKPSS